MTELNREQDQSIQAKRARMRKKNDKLFGNEIDNLISQIESQANTFSDKHISKLKTMYSHDDVKRMTNDNTKQFTEVATNLIKAAKGKNNLEYANYLDLQEQKISSELPDTQTQILDRDKTKVHYNSMTDKELITANDHFLKTGKTEKGKDFTKENLDIFSMTFKNRGMQAMHEKIRLYAKEVYHVNEPYKTSDQYDTYQEFFDDIPTIENALKNKQIYAKPRNLSVTVKKFDDLFPTLEDFNKTKKR